ncbi:MULTISPECIES: outer membrane beta-barrel protein [Dickeya]|uniref:Capsular biosynthesis protein n=1 Tax=Dickeya fangzhongdai TaxID=1778540 RepID=A0A2K8QIS5_9GAMM|nr:MULTISPECIES: outer membrane beta-barrel protein [Dickeya]ATZ92985.1 capsular biosynthesis protein [Dickeya fangzhongdai]QOH46416.1 capsular biosynthesis protein [Dickeya fangzhongdai]QOH50723.1 capsular biosynthesis protein [Dickeya fangzhongdai]UGA53115.1 outer membrane beta-barrel protein [Dickeya fangzhongdai]UMB79019.1 outer membrane beta-barrel protein [Dickeya fangzhongdai]
MRTKLIIAAGMIMPHPSWADLTPKSHIGIAGIDFQSQVGLDYGHENNVTYQAYDQDAVSSDFQSVRPMIKAIGARYQDQYLLMYSGDYRRYDRDSADNYTDHFFRFNGAWRYGLKHGLTLSLEDSLGHEARGRGISEGFRPQQFSDFGINSPLSSELFNSELRYSYGAPKGRGKAEVALLFKKLRLGHVDDIKNTDIDFYNYVRGQEWHENGLIAELSDQYSRTTRFRYRFINNQRRYEVDSQKDNDEYYLEYGIKSQLTGKTRVDANVAWLYKTFDNNPNARDFSGVNWDIQAEWKPLEQSVFTVHTSQHIKDPSEVGGYIMASKYGISYQHFWLADRFSTTFDYSYLAEGYKNYPKDRKDRNRVFTFAMSYNFRPSINVELKYQLNTLRSNQDTDSFFIGPDGDRQVVRMLGRDNSLIMFTAKVQI